MNKVDTKVTENSLPIEKKNSIFLKILKFFRSFFNNKADIKKNEEKQTQPKIENINLGENTKSNFTESIKKSSIDETAKLQQDYKSGVIKEDDLTEEQYNGLIKLYDKQIDYYKTSINMKKEQLKSYKSRITEIRKKLA